MQPGWTYWYKLEVMCVRGQGRFHGPVEAPAAPTGPRRILLPLIAAK